MNIKEITVLVATLFAIVAAAKHNSKHPSYYQGPHHNIDPANLDIALEHRLTQEDIIEDPSQNDLEIIHDNVDKERADIPISSFKRFLGRESVPAKCDYLNSPMYSCYNCYSYLVCKPSGGKIKACQDPYAPYCNNGICSPTPSTECSAL